MFFSFLLLYTHSCSVDAKTRPAWMKVTMMTFILKRFGSSLSGPGVMKPTNRRFYGCRSICGRLFFVMLRATRWWRPRRSLIVCLTLAVLPRAESPTQVEFTAVKSGLLSGVMPRAVGWSALCMSCATPPGLRFFFGGRRCRHGCLSTSGFLFGISF